MVARLRERLGEELERLSRELVARVPADRRAERAPASYDSSLELHRIVQRRIRLLGQLLAGLASVDPASISPDRAGFGSVVRARDLATGADVTYTLMTGDFIDLDEGQVSLDSPVGHALLGRRVGDRVVVRAPNGEKRYEVVDLTTLPRKLSLADAGVPEPVGDGDLQIA